MKNILKCFILNIWCHLSSGLVVATAGFIIGYIVIKGYPVVDWQFITHGPKGMPLGIEGGILPAILGTLSLGLVCCLVACSLGLTTGIYLYMYCGNNLLKDSIRLVVQCIAGIPSIVLGLFGYTFLVYHLNMGISLLAGGITLGIMVFPIVAVSTEKALQEFDQDLVKASYGLGVTKSYTLFKVILPHCKSDIIAGILLAVVLAMGATAPIILTAAVMYAHHWPQLFAPVMALPYHLYMLAAEGIALQHAYGTALVLVGLLLIIKLLAVFFAHRKGR